MANLLFVKLIYAIRLWNWNYYRLFCLRPSLTTAIGKAWRSESNKASEIRSSVETETTRDGVVKMMLEVVSVKVKIYSLKRRYIRDNNMEKGITGPDGDSETLAPSAKASF